MSFLNLEIKSPCRSYFPSVQIHPRPRKYWFPARAVDLSAIQTWAAGKSAGLEIHSLSKTIATVACTVGRIVAVAASRQAWGQDRLIV